MRHIDYEVFVRMMNRWTDEDQARLAQAKARHLLPSCAFVNAVRADVRDAGGDLDPDLVHAARNMRADTESNMALYTTKGPRGSAAQRLYVNGTRCGVAHVVVDEVSGEIEVR